MDRLTSHSWSGNVRELENEIERTVALAGDADSITVEMLSEHLRGAPEASVSMDWVAPGADLNSSVDALKRQMIREALEQAGSKTRAAEKLGIPRQSLQKMMKRLNLND
jgi:two-component system response regulator HupR/HoxA